MVVYRDKNAITKLTFSDGSSENITNENHSFLVAMIKIPAMNMLRALLRDGIYDGIGAFKNILRFIGLQNIAPANIFKDIVDKKFGGPFINISDTPLNWTLRSLSGVPPRYNGERIFDSELINRIRDLYFSTKHIFNITKSIRINIAIQSNKFWNPRHIRTSFLHFYMPQEFVGYSPFIWYKIDGHLSNTVKRVQDLFPGIFYESYNYYWNK